MVIKWMKVICHGIEQIMPRGVRGQGLLTRLLQNTDVAGENDCWLWKGGTNNIGYGMMRDGKKMRTVHRVSYEEHNEDIIDRKMVVIHMCNHYTCVNPKHLKKCTLQEKYQYDVEHNRYFVGKRERPNKPMPKTTCKHCDATITVAVHGRYHGDRCKFKKT